MAATILGETVLHEGWGRFLLLRLRLPNGAEVTREVEDHGDAVCVLPYDPDRRVATFVRQFRTPVFKVTGEAGLLEAPAGRLEEDAAEGARREVLEETGLRLRRLDFLLRGWASPGVSTERMDFFLAEYGTADRVGAGGGLDSENEDITVVELPLAEVARMVASGALDDVKTLVLVQALQLRRPDLFG